MHGQTSVVDHRVGSHRHPSRSKLTVRDNEADHAEVLYGAVIDRDVDVVCRRSRNYLGSGSNVRKVFSVMKDASRSLEVRRFSA